MQIDFGVMDPNIESGIDLSTDLNNWRDTVHSSHAGSARPAYAVAGMVWIKNTVATAWEFNVYDGTNDITMFTIDTVANNVNLGTLVAPVVLQKGAGNSTVISTSANGLAIVGDGDGGLTLASPNSSFSNLYWGSPANPIGASASWKNSTLAFVIGTKIATGSLSLQSGAGVTNFYMGGGGQIGIGTTSGLLAKLHIKTGASGQASIDGWYDDFLVEGSSHTGMSIFSPSTTRQGIAFGNELAKLAGFLYWDETALIMKLSPNRSQGKLQLGFGGAVVGMTMLGETGKEGWVGVMNSTPECPFHIGVGMTDAVWDDSLVNAQSVLVTHPSFLRVMLHGHDASGINFIAQNNGVDHRLMSVDWRFGELKFRALNDDLTTRQEFIIMKASDGVMIFGTYAGTGTRTLKVQADGTVIAV